MTSPTFGQWWAAWSAHDWIHQWQPQHKWLIMQCVNIINILMHYLQAHFVWELNSAPLYIPAAIIFWFFHAYLWFWEGLVLQCWSQEYIAANMDQRQMTWLSQSPSQLKHKQTNKLYKTYPWSSGNNTIWKDVDVETHLSTDVSKQWNDLQC